MGVLTTVVSLGTYYACVLTSLNPDNALQLQIANIISWVASVTFAYFTNRSFVFHSEATEFGEKVVEFCKFILGRLFTMAFEYIGCALLFKFVPIPAVISKCIITIFVIILNFFISKFFAFKSKEEII